MPRKCAASVFIAIFLALAAFAQQPARPPASPAGAITPLSAPLPAVVPPNRPVIGVALEGGGALGLAHIGVLQWLEEHHIPIDRLAGTSMGALVGALYAGGQTPAQMHALAASDAFTGVFTLQTPYIDSNFRRRQDRRQNPGITLGLKHTLALRNALLADHGVDEFLTTNLLAYNRQQLEYNQLPIPFRCVATDLNTLQPVTFAAGPLPQAVRASISIPGVFPPVQASNGHYLVDGGILDNLPTDVLKRDLQAEIVIAVRLQEAAIATPDTSSIVGVLNRAFDAGIERNVDQAMSLANVVVNVPIGNFSTTDYAKSDALVNAGYQAAEQNRAVLLPYALDDQSWAAYLAARDSRRLAPPGILRQVRVEGGAAAAQHQVLADFKPLKAQPISAARTLEAAKSASDWSIRIWAASVPNFAPPPASAT